MHAPDGGTFSVGPCCAPKLSFGSPVFQDVGVFDDPVCASTSATTIAKALCIGNATCTISVAHGTTFTWRVASADATSCGDGANVMDNRGGSITCSARLATFPAETSCGSGGKNSQEKYPYYRTQQLAVVAKCYRTQVRRGHVARGGTTWGATRRTVLGRLRSVAKSSRRHRSRYPRT